MAMIIKENVRQNSSVLILNIEIMRLPSIHSAKKFCKPHEQLGGT